MTGDTVLVLVLAALGLAMFWSYRTFSRWLDAYRIARRRIVCPVHGKHAEVAFLVDAAGPDVYRDVVACSLIPQDEPIACGKACRSVGVAPFGTRAAVAASGSA
jgi:hypothetical protein